MFILSFVTSYCEVDFYEGSDYITEKEFRDILIKRDPLKSINFDFLVANDEKLNIRSLSDMVIGIMEILGEDSYPLINDFYIENIVGFENENDYQKYKISSLYYKGIITEDSFGKINPEKKINYQDGISIADRIFNQDKRFKPSLVSLEFKDKMNFEVKSLKRNVFFSGEEVVYKVNLENHGMKDDYLWAGFTLIDPNGKNYDVPAEKIALAGKKNESLDLIFKIPQNIVSGKYKAVIAIWDTLPSESTSSRIGNWENPGGIYIYNYNEEFEYINEKKWQISSGKLGRSIFGKNNVKVSDGFLAIKIPEKTLNGGEISSTKSLSYGSYEIKMKVPNASSSITGFFLYKSPDYFNEIDIEVVNDESGEFWLTTYSDGKKNNAFIGNLGIDFSKDFHIFRIEYYKDYLSFYIDDMFLKKWTEGYSHNSMNLMVNCWFPSWMEGVESENEEYLIIDNIKY